MRPIVKKTLEKKVGKAQLFIFGTAFYLEVLAAACIILGIVISFMGLPARLGLLMDGKPFLEFLKYMFNLVIGIELLKMFCRHDLDSVVEVLLFAVARQVIIEHTSMVDNLLGVLAIAVLFSIRKFLFVSALDKKGPSFKVGEPEEENADERDVRDAVHGEKRLGSLVRESAAASQDPPSSDKVIACGEAAAGLPAGGKPEHPAAS